MGPHPTGPSDAPTLLIANRGEIAIRIARTAARLGWRVVAVVADGDPSPHGSYCDEVVRVPSYLDGAAIVAAASTVGADFVHPGYGFLSERAAFARMVATAGLRLVGPSPEVMEQLGDKVSARSIAVAAGVPVVPSYDARDAGAPDSFRFPVLVKAAAGGGGKGMRVVRHPADLAEAMAAAARESQAAFGDDRLLIEAFVEHGRHIEVQVFGDMHGHVLHLGERDCSVQRRHQKVIEESPAPTLTAAQRSEICAAAVALAERVGYVGAGTVEFLLDATTGAFYFLEMNTRLQVEHPVTEAVTGLDLVEWQLRVAQGEPLPLRQEQVRWSGHAIEARIYAEDPYTGFLPQAGVASYVAWPVRLPRVYRDAGDSGPGALGPSEDATLRIDHALASGQEVSARFDPMLAKVIVHGSTREAARLRLIEALDDTVIAGLTTNTGFLRELLASSAYAEAALETGTLDSVVPDAEPGLIRARRLAAAVVGAAYRRTGVWASDGWRLGAPAVTAVLPLDAPVEVERPIETDPLALGHRVTLPASAEQIAGKIAGQADGELLAGMVWRHPHGIEVVCRGQRTLLPLRDPFAREGAAATDGVVTAPMSGTVLRVEVAPGLLVAEGAALGVLEAMKMEFVLRAPVGGVVAEVAVEPGSQVALGAPLFRIEAGEVPQ